MNDSNQRRDPQDADGDVIPVHIEPEPEPAAPEEEPVEGEVEAEDDPHRACFEAIEELQRELAERDRKLREYIEAHQAAVAEMDAARARLERDREAELDRSRAELAGSMLEVVDDLDRTLDGAAKTQNLEAVLEGTSLVRSRFVKKLEELGVEPMNALGETFDPNQHEAVALVPVTDPQQDQQVLAEELPGYQFRGKLLRAARVVVGTLTEG